MSSQLEETAAAAVAERPAAVSAERRAQADAWFLRPVVLVPAAIALLAASAVIGHHLPLTRDEVWHWPVTLLFGAGLPQIEVLAAYRAGPAPLSYLIWANLHSLGADLGWLRALSMLMLLVSVVGLYYLARALKAPHPVIPTAFILLQPYVFINGFLLMSDCLALAFAVWSLYFIVIAMRSGEWRHWGYASALTALLLYTRQPYIVIPAGLFAAAVLVPEQRYRTFTTAALSVLAIGPLVALWGGYSTITQTRDPVWVSEHLNHFLAWIGFFFWPYLVTRPKWKAPDQRFLWAIPAVFAVFILSGFRDTETLLRAGVFDHAVVLTGKFGPDWMPYLFFGLFWAIGAAVCSVVAFNAWSEPSRRILLLMAMAAAATSLVTGIWWERHFIPAYLLIGVLAWTEPVKRRGVAYAWLGAMGVLCLAHMTDVFLKSILNQELIVLVLRAIGR